MAALLSAVSSDNPVIQAVQQRALKLSDRLVSDQQLDLATQQLYLARLASLNEVPTRYLYGPAQDLLLRCTAPLLVTPLEQIDQSVGCGSSSCKWGNMSC